MTRWYQTGYGALAALFWLLFCILVGGLFFEAVDPGVRAGSIILFVFLMAFILSAITTAKTKAA